MLREHLGWSRGGQTNGRRRASSAHICFQPLITLWLILHISITKPCGWSILVFKPQKQHRCLFELHQKRLHCFFFVFLKLWWWNILTVMRLFDCQGVSYELPMVLVCSRGSAVSTGSVALEGRPAPALLTARTLNWYRAPSFRPNTG